MSDGTLISPGSAGGDLVWTEDVGSGSGKIQRVKLAIGVLDTDGGDIAASNPMPVVGTLTANPNDPTAGTGSITAQDVGSTSNSNSLSQSYYTGTSTANSTVSLSFSGCTSLLVQVSGTFNGTIEFHHSMDGGTTWFLQLLQVAQIGGPKSSVVLSDNKPYLFRGNAAELTNFRVRCSAFTSGTLTVRIQVGYGDGLVTVNQGNPGPATGTASGWPVTVQSDTTTPVNIQSVRSTTATLTSVNGATSSTSILASNTNRKAASIFNDSTAILYIRMDGGTASTSNYSVQIPSGGYFEFPQPVYTGAVTGIWGSATGAAKITEYS